MQDFCRKTKRQVFRGNSNEDDYDEALDDTILGTFFQPASIRTLLDFLITSLRHFCWELLNERSFLILDRHCLDIFNFCCLLSIFLSEFTFLSARCQLISSPQELFFFSRSPLLFSEKWDTFLIFFYSIFSVLSVCYKNLKLALSLYV